MSDYLTYEYTMDIHPSPYLDKTLYDYLIYPIDIHKSFFEDKPLNCHFVYPLDI